MLEILKRINEAKHITVIAHRNPDADSLSSASAMYTHILRLHKKVSFFCITENIDNKFAFLPWFDKIRNTFPSSSDLAISLDCGSYDRIGIELKCDLINIDHHQSNTNFGELSLVDSTCISTTEVLYNFFIKNGIKINEKIATALYAGLLDDSNGLLSDEVDGTTFALVSKLIEHGADYKICNQFIMKYMTLGAFRIKGIMQTNMQLLSEAKIALFYVSDSDMKKTGARGADCEYALEEALYLPTVKVALLLKQNSDFSIKGSLRSKNNIDISAIASNFRGGGHRSRAGFNVESVSDLESLKIEIIKLINKEI
jgi:phosphoesterase RecJ-like protein